jgi:hypothetical protein
MKFFLDENHLQGKKVKLSLSQYFSFWMPFQNLKLFLGVLRSTEYKDEISFVYITSNHKRSPPMAKLASAAAGRIFPWGGPRIRGLRLPWPGEEKHLHLAQLQQDGGQPAGKVKAVHQPPAAVYLLQIQMFCQWLSLASSSKRSHSCSETS